MAQQWNTLRDAYGSAADIPALIDDWTQAPSQKLMDKLWSRLCHQGTVYSASFAAIPLLVRACPTLQPKDRRSALLLISAILASSDRFGDAKPDPATAELTPALRQMIDTSMGDADIDVGEFPYLLQAAAAFYGDTFWGSCLGLLADEEFPGRCPKCDGEIFLAIGQSGYFASAEDYTRNLSAHRVPIAPASEGSMPTSGAWLHKQAAQHAQAETANGVAHVFGTTSCPTCNAAISVAAAIELALAPA
jgi:hypothetical protein